MIKYDRNIFDVIDNQEKAYWLGFIVADGYLNTSKNMLRIKLGERDQGHLIKFIKFIGGDINMLKTEVHGITGNNVMYVSLYSKEITSALLKLGIRQAKSGEETVCDIEDQYHKSFIRGIWDGDGFIRENLTGVGVVGSRELLEFIQQHIKDNLGINPLKVHPHGCIFKIEYRSTKKAIPLILDYFYGGQDVALDRKKELATRRKKIC